MSGIALFGGTFDPPHLGHRRLLEAAIAAVKPSHTIIIPDRIPPHKVNKDLTAPEDRLEMCRLAFGDIPGVGISDWELMREGKSYSIYTVTHLREVYPEDELWFIMGSDMLLSFGKWYRSEEILQKCRLLCLARTAGDKLLSETAAEQIAIRTGDRNSVKVVRAEPLELSSTQVRKRLLEGKSCEGLLSENVIRYIKEKGLYTQ